MKNLTALLTRLAHWGLYGLLLLSPLLVLPFTRNLIVDTKFLLVFVVLILVTLTFALKTLVEQKWELAVSPLTFPILLFGLAVLLSTLFTNKYQAEALLGIGGVYLALVLISLFASALIKGDHTQTVIRILGLSGALLGVSMLLQFYGWGPTQLINSVSSFNLPHTLLFNLSGSSFVALQVMALALVGLFSWSLIHKKWQALDIVLIGLNIVGLGVALWSLMPGQIAQIVIPPLQASWVVMLRSLESWQSALIGHGPAAYANAYARFKPLWTNGQSYWQTNFGTGTSALFTLPVTLGLFGLLSWLILFGQVLKQRKQANKEAQPLWRVLVVSFVI